MTLFLLQASGLLSMRPIRPDPVDAAGALLGRRCGQ